MSETIIGRRQGPQVLPSQPPPTNLETMPGIAPRTAPIFVSTPEAAPGNLAPVPIWVSTPEAAPGNLAPTPTSNLVSTPEAQPGNLAPGPTQGRGSPVSGPGPSGGTSGSTTFFMFHVADRIDGKAIMNATVSLQATPFGYPYFGSTDSHGDCTVDVQNYNLPILAWGVLAPGYVSVYSQGQPALVVNVLLDPETPPAPTETTTTTTTAGTQQAAAQKGGFDWKVIVPIILMLLIVLGLAWAGTSKKKGHGGEGHRHSRRVSRKSR